MRRRDKSPAGESERIVTGKNRIGDRKIGGSAILMVILAYFAGSADGAIGGAS